MSAFRSVRKGFLRGLVIGLLTCLAAVASAPTKNAWPDVPEELFTRTPKDYDGAPPAVIVLEKRMFEKKKVTFFRRVLVLTMAGKAAAEKVGINPDATGIEGRVVCANGKIIPMEMGKDILLQVHLKAKARNVNTFQVIPPGISGTCVVDLRWNEPIDEEWRCLPKFYDLNMNEKLASEVPVLRSEILLAHFWQEKNWEFKFEVSAKCRPREEDPPEGHAFIFENIPADLPTPFACGADHGVPRLLIYFSFDIKEPLERIYGLDKIPKITYWKAIAQALICDLFETKVRKTSKYEDWAGALVGSLPAASPQVRAETLLRQLQAVVKPSGQLTMEEASRLAGKVPKDDPVRLGEALEAGVGSPLTLQVLFFDLLKRAHLEPVILLVVDRDEHRPRFNEANPFQFDHCLVGIKAEKDKPILYDPASRWSGGKPLPCHLNMDALLILPGARKKDWETGIIPTQSQAMGLHAEAQTYRIEFDDEETRIQLESKATGAPAWDFRQRYARLEAADQRKAIRHALEKNLASAKWEVSALTDAPENDSPLVWRASAVQEREPGRTYRLDPFPCFELAFPIPATWPDSRTSPILLPYTGTFEAVCEVPLPAGYRVPEGFRFSRNNAFGEVDWILEPPAEGPAPRVMRIRLRITCKTLQAPADSYPKLKEWIGWIREAESGYLLLEKT